MTIDERMARVERLIIRHLMAARIDRHEDMMRQLNLHSRPGYLPPGGVCAELDMALQRELRELKAMLLPESEQPRAPA